MTSTSRMRGTVVSILALLLAGLMLSACGSSGDSTTDSEVAAAKSDTTAAPSTSSEQSSYDGAENHWLTPFATPEVKPDTKFKVGYMQVYGAIPLLTTMENGAAEEVEKLGGEMISVDAELDIEQQAAGFDQFLAQGVDAIIGYPVVAKALAPQLAKAEAAGIPVVTTSSVSDVTTKVPKGIMSDVNAAYDFAAYETMKALSAEKPGASFTIMGLAAPVESLEYLAERKRYWGENFGLEFEGQIDTKEDNPEAYAAAATAIFGKYPDTQAISVYNELVASSTATVAQTSGKTDVLIMGNDGAAVEGIEAIKAGRLFSEMATPWGEIGKEMVRGAYDAVTGQGLPLPEKVSLRGELVTADNADETEPTIEG